MRNITPRDYQQAAYKAITQSYRDGSRRVAVQMPTGSGKTVIIAMVVEAIINQGGRALVLAHTEELIEQAARTLETALPPDVSLGIVRARRNETSAQVVVGMVQSVRSPRRLAALGTFDLIVIDECHHAAAKSYLGILNHYGALGDSGPLVLGCSATLDRGDGVGLTDVFHKVVFDIDILTLIERGYLVDVRAKRVGLAGLNLDTVKRKPGRYGDWDDGALGQAMEDANGPAEVAEAVAAFAPDRKSAVFVPTVRIAEETARELRARGLRAVAVSGQTPPDERRNIIAQVRSGEVQAVCNALVLTEGFDAPVIDCIVAARPTQSRALYQQMVGRGLRTSPGKRDCLVLDLAGNTARHDLQHAGELFGLAEGDMREGETVTQSLARVEQETAAREHRAARLVAFNVRLFDRSLWNWISTPAGALILTGMETSYGLVPYADGETCDVYRLEVANYDLRPVLMSRGVSLELGQGIAEENARQNGAGGTTQKDAGWRNHPVTDKQMRLLRGLRPAGWNRVHLKGEASDLITLAKAAKALAGVVPGDAVRMPAPLAARRTEARSDAPHVKPTPSVDLKDVLAKWPAVADQVGRMLDQDAGELIRATPPRRIAGDVIYLSPRNGYGHAYLNRADVRPAIDKVIGDLIGTPVRTACLAVERSA